MAERANIDDVEAIKRLRAAVAKFAEQVSVAVSDAAGEVNKTQQWLEVEQSHKWKLELRKRHERLQQALEQLRMKQLFRGPSGEKQGTADEQHRVKLCRAALEEAERKVKAIESHKGRLAREAALFQGAISRLSGIAHQSAPAALAEMGNLIVALEKYRSIQVTEAGSTAEPGLSGSAPAVAGGTEAGVMARPTDGQAGAGGPGAGTAGVSEKPGEQTVPDGAVSREAVLMFVARARDGLRRIRAGEVVYEVGVDLRAAGAGGVAVWRDAFSQRLFAGLLVREGGGAALGGLESMTRGQLLEALPGVRETLGVEASPVTEGRGVGRGGGDGAAAVGAGASGVEPPVASRGDGWAVFEGGEIVEHGN